MDETSALTAEVRERGGKGAARAVRRQGRVPAVIYGDRKPPVPISLPSKEATLRLHAGGFLTHVLTIDIAGETIRVIPKDYQLDPVKDTLVHVDFLRVGAGMRLVVEIPVRFVNEDRSPGLRRGGVLNVVRHVVELEVPADAIPEGLTADLDGLDINDGIHISNIALPAGVRPTITDRDFTIATIAPPAGLTEDLEGPVQAGATEVIGEGAEDDK